LLLKSDQVYTKLATVNSFWLNKYPHLQAIENA